MYVYRYIPFDRFKEVVEDKALYFVNPLRWDDEKEAFLFRAVKDIEQKRIIEEYLKDYRYKYKIITQLEQGCLYNDNGNNECNKEENSKENLDWFGMRCQSWCNAENSPEMWEEYSEEKQSVCIEVWLPKLLKLHYGKNKVEGFNVEYKNTLTVEEELEKSLGSHNEFYFPFVLQNKSIEYLFEDEYRLFVCLLDSDGKYIGKDDEKEGIKVTIDEDISSFISKVYCNPEASGKFKDEVGAYCSKNKFNFIRNDKIGKEDN
jgi:hypothetical protein